MPDGQLFTPLSGIIIGPSSHEAKALIQEIIAALGPDLVYTIRAVGDINASEVGWASAL